MKRFILIVFVLSLAACSAQPAEVSVPTEETDILPAATLIPTPIQDVFVPFWQEFPLIGPENPVIYTNETQEYQSWELDGTIKQVDQDTRFSMRIAVNQLAEDVGDAATGFTLVSNHPEGYLTIFFLAYQYGSWSIGYLPNHLEGNFTYLHGFENLVDPVQNFVLTFSEDGHRISLQNDSGLDFVDELEEKLFDGMGTFTTVVQIAPQTEIVLSELIISQFQLEPVEEELSEPEDCVPSGAAFAEEQDLLHWTTNLVNAYGGQFMLGGELLDAEDLTDEITQNLEEYMVEIGTAGQITRFLVVEGIPLAVCNCQGYWQEATLRDLGDLLGIRMGTLIGSHSGIWDDLFWKNEYHTGVTHVDNPNLAYEAPFDWQWSNRQVQAGQRNQLELRIHPILFPGYMPPWLISEYTDENLDHMTRIIVEYARDHEIQEIVVANECSINMMEDIIRAFTLTREMYPEAKLIYNDTRNHFVRYNYSDVHRTIEISETLLELGLIDYVGVQMHVDEETLPIKEEVIQVFSQYPVPVVITEFDALLTYLPEDQRDAKMEEITTIVFESCIESGVCIGITTWGENDATSWDGRSLLRDENNLRKAAYYAALRTMYEHLPPE